ncbi:sensor histidine kinase NtrY-like [Xanthobacter tagetidis]|jgi:two-component system nitrogen regulation sensor histidine kinase NtrY|uniref:histidine kinase n=1 Tax=Xanthobacter tagetidis TaxID=60216 RepID=A0A3L7ACX8_9HYPH|nr:PAS domain-containing sensor histidine kinase [Xanthobacter tagetidis]MBB6309728.1 two-component system nitrogen regulation sensor histidine kinase NtrY [Xanthobacter tagetidis]RLP78239.1 PAS domain-containing sensor histidine kinase [Xanthobacter tagetidis]
MSDVPVEDHVAEPVLPKRRGLARFTAPVIVGLALASAVATFLVLMGLTSVVPSPEVVVGMLAASGVAVLALAVVIGLEVWGIVRARARGRAASRLHVRIVALFAVIAVVPTIVVAVVASLTLDRSLDRFFSSRTQEIVATAGSVAQTYIREHALSIRGDVMAMANDISRLKELYDSDPEKFRQILTAQAALRNVPGAQIIRRDLSVVERANLRTEKEYLVPANIAVGDATVDQPIIYLPSDADFVGGVIPLQNFGDMFLYVARPIDPRVIGYLKVTSETLADYRSLEERRTTVQLAFAAMYAVITLIVLLSAVWLGINFSKWLVAPIRRLMWAAGRVAGGNLDVQVPVHRAEGDLASLGETFNKMTGELRAQRNAIVTARDQIDSRRRFTEAVLAGVGAGVIGLDADERVTIVNRSAERLLGLTEAEALGRKLAEVVPETAALLAEAESASQRIVQGNITVQREGRERVLAMRVTTEQSAEDDHGWVVTLDDITALIAAQRTSAWADVARRIAHEIKNPLTPIQLSAERLKRKYGRHITQDRDVFDQCTDTIIRQVGDIGRMVDEFSSFARMPKPVVDAQDLTETIRQSVFLARVGHPDLTFETDLPASLPARYDRRLISQALTNILKNAAEAIEAVPSDVRGPGLIRIKAQQVGDDLIMDVIDNGTGLPQDKRNRLLEPYVTTREKGTGLGLAIVGKIMEEHGGGIELNDAPDGRGAWIRLRLRQDGRPEGAPAPAPAADTAGRA